MVASLLASSAATREEELSLQAEGTVFVLECPTTRWNLRALIARGYDPDGILKGILVSRPYTANATDKARRTPLTLLQESFHP